MSDQASSTINPIAAPPQTPGYDFKSAFFTLKGRLIRKHFWISYLILYAASIVLSLIPVINLIAAPAILWGKFAVNIKRLHDMGKSGWLAAVPLAVSALSTLIALSTIGYLLAIIASGDTDAAETLVASIAFNGMILSVLGLVNLGFLLWIGLTDSQTGTNKYGPNPKAA